MATDIQWLYRLLVKPRVTKDKKLVRHGDMIQTAGSQQKASDDCYGQYSQPEAYPTGRMQIKAAGKLQLMLKLVVPRGM